MDTLAVVFEQPETLSVRRLPLLPPADEDVVVAIRWSGISTGTERLLYTGTMPPFPGLGYPLVPGYEAVGTIVQAGPASGRTEGQLVFIAGSKGFEGARGLFGGQAARVVVPGARTVPITDAVGEKGTLFALAATAYHALGVGQRPLPDLIIGHGALGRLIARLTLVLGGDAPTVWEINPTRMSGATGYRVVHPDDDQGTTYQCIQEVSGANGLIDTLVSRLKPRGTIVLAGFYHEPVSFVFPPAFLREATFTVAAQWAPGDLVAVAELANSGKLDLDGLITHRQDAS
ncbi:MAG TPA: chlorophyll synthesis pathway protein BchC, partial [Arachnia sp.]|nr:chlorophyll synthesis pathway protein BchC [Arachnia sp.]